MLIVIIQVYVYDNTHILGHYDMATLKSTYYPKDNSFQSKSSKLFVKAEHNIRVLTGSNNN